MSVATNGRRMGSATPATHYTHKRVVAPGPGAAAGVKTSRRGPLIARAVFCDLVGLVAGAALGVFAVMTGLSVRMDVEGAPLLVAGLAAAVGAVVGLIGVEMLGAAFALAAAAVRTPGRGRLLRR
jgi:hypothetical protein